MSTPATPDTERATRLRRAIEDWLSRPRIRRVMLEGSDGEERVLTEPGLVMLEKMLPVMDEPALIATAGALLRTSGVRLAVALHMSSKHDMRFEHAKQGIEEMAKWAKGDQPGEEDEVGPEPEVVPPPEGMKVWKGDA